MSVPLVYLFISVENQISVLCMLGKCSTTGSHSSPWFSDIGFYCVVQACLKVEIHLLLPPEFWGDICVPFCQCSNILITGLVLYEGVIESPVSFMLVCVQEDSPEQDL